MPARPGRAASYLLDVRDLSFQHMRDFLTLALFMGGGMESHYVSQMKHLFNPFPLGYLKSIPNLLLSQVSISLSKTLWARGGLKCGNLGIFFQKGHMVHNPFTDLNCHRILDNAPPNQYIKSYSKLNECSQLTGINEDSE